MTGRRTLGPVVAAAGALVVVALGGHARAAAPAVPLTIAVSVDGDAPRWHLDAWAGSLRYHLDRASRLRVAETDEAASCGGRPTCLLNSWSGRADLLVLGTSDGTQLTLSLWSVAGRRRLSEVAVDTDRDHPDEQLRRAAVSLARPLQLAAHTVTDAAAAPDATVRNVPLLVIDGLGALLALVLLGLTRARRVSLRVLAVALLLLTFARSTAVGDVIVGALWGWWLVEVLPALVAPAPRLDRAPGRMLLRVLSGVALQSALRTAAWLLVDGLILGVVLLGCRAAGMPWREVLAGPLLVAALLVRQALTVLPLRVARALDGQTADARDKSHGHHRAVMRTLRGHFRRHGLNEELERLDAVTIIVTDGEDVTGYGEPDDVRLLVGRELLRAAGVKPAADRDVNLRVDARWSAGLIVPRAPTTSAASGIPPALDEEAGPSGRRRRFLDRSAEVRGHHAPLDGWVLPRRGDVRPLLADSAADHAVVSSLVQAPRARFGRPGYDDEHDDSDPDHKDFLVGALLREILRVQCASPAGGPTLGQWLARSRWSSPWARLRALMRPVVERHAIYADLLTSLHRGRDALMQDLARRLALPVELTARANAPLLLRRSLAILEAVDAGALQRPEGRRLRALGRLFGGEHAQGSSRWALLLSAAALLALTTAATVEAVRYHPRYQALMAAEAARLDAPPPSSASTSPEGGDHDEPAADGATDDAR